MTYFILLPGASLLSDVTYVHNVLATSLISLLHTVLDGGPRKWTYEDPSKPMTYQHQYDQIVIIINFLIGPKKVESVFNWPKNIFFVLCFVLLKIINVRNIRFSTFVRKINVFCSHL